MSSYLEMAPATGEEAFELGRHHEDIRREALQPSSQSALPALHLSELGLCLGASDTASMPHALAWLKHHQML